MANNYADRVKVALEDLKERIAKGKEFPDACDAASDEHRVKYNDLQLAYDFTQAGEPIPEFRQDKVRRMI